MTAISKVQSFNRQTNQTLGHTQEINGLEKKIALLQTKKMSHILHGTDKKISNRKIQALEQTLHSLREKPIKDQELALLKKSWFFRRMLSFP